jgi:ribosome-associated toxin RatA of RatAB toxin-antitoxin module
MRSRIALLTLAVTIVALAALAPTPALAQAQNMRELTATEQAKVEAGEIILESQTYKDEQGRSRGRGLAIGYIKAPKDKIIDTILKYEDYPQFMPRVKATEVYLRTDTAVNVKFTIEVVLVKVTYYLTHKVDRAAGIITWTLDKSKPNEIAATDGFWGLKPYKDGTLVYYSVSADTGRAIPKTIEDYLTKKDLPNIINSIKKRVGG